MAGQGFRAGHARSIAERVRAPAQAELPSPHLELEWRPLAPTDTGQLRSLIREADEAEGTVIDSVTDVLIDLVVRNDYSHLDTVGGFDRAGILRAYAAVYLWPTGDVANVVFYGATDPSWAGRGIGRALLAWQEGRGRQLLARVPGAGPANLTAYVEETAADRRRLLVAAGFSPVHTYLKMRRDLAAPISEAPLPEGLVITHASEVSEASVRHAHTQGARDVWGEGPLTPEGWHRRWQEYRREWSFVVLDPSEGSEAVVGYLLSLPQVEALSPARRTEGAIHRLNIIPSHRGRGIGRALAVRALQAFAGSQLRFASVIVDPENTNSGFGLYDDLGFAPTTRAIVYGVQI